MLGPFALSHPLGQGGMAVVWAGRHATRDVPVAIKIMKGPAHAEARRLFRQEVRAVASLDHPHVVQVLDVGELPESVVSLGLEPGAPYLVMERAAGTLQRPHRGDALRSVLLQLLDALAHAHARGLVHLDLKATNVLTGGRRAGVRLSDFGLAQAWRDHRDAPRAGSRGTPSHMALEQLEGGEVGPWTDLYALGVLAWRLATGHRPYEARSLLEAAVAMTQPLPTFEADLGVPRGFEAWVRGLLQRDPSRRYRRASDAAYALLQLGGPEAWAGARRGAASDVPAPDAVTLLFDTVTELTPRERDPVALRPHPAPLPSFALPPRTAAPDLAGAGIGLFALRDVGVVGRAHAQRWLWEHLLAAATHRTPRLVTLAGPPGVGASRLARWVCERAHELGAGEVLQARHGPAPEPAHGVGPMLASAFRVVGLPPHRVRARLEEGGIDPTDAATLAAVIDPQHAKRPVRSSAERQRLVTVALRCLGARRPLVVWFDDVGFDDDSVALVRHLARQSDAPWLLVLTGAPDDMDGEHLELRPLDGRAVDDLIRRSLGVDERVAAAVVARADGRPMAALQLLSWLVDDGALRPGAAGLRASASALEGLPATLERTFRARVDAVAPESVPALQLAALLGHHVPLDEWRAGCLQLGIPWIDAHHERLLGAGLLRSVAGGVGFVHDAQRRGLRPSDDHQRVRWHRVLADVVDAPERRAHHLLAAGDAAAALAPLSRAAQQARDRGAARRAEGLWEASLVALDACGAPPDDPQRSTALLQLARSLRVRGAWADAAAAATRLLREARRQGWDRQVGNALVELAMEQHNAGELGRARALLVEAYDASRPGSSSRAAAALRRSLLAIDAGDHDTATSMAREALDFYGSPGAGPSGDVHWNDDIGAGYAHVVLGRCRLRQGAAAPGLRHLDRATERFERAADRLATADALNYRAGALLHLGRTEEAEAPFRSALAHYEALGAWSAVLVRVNLAVLAIDRGRLDEARGPLEAALRQLDSEGREAFAAAVRVFLLPCLAAAADRARFEDVARRAQDALARTGFVDPDVTRIARRAWAEARQRGWATEAVGAIAHR